MTRHCERRCHLRRQTSHCHEDDEKVYGEYIRRFTFGNEVSLPIVQPGNAVVFATQTVREHNLRYVENADEIGIIAPRGIYRILLELKLGEGAEVSILVNGSEPLARDGLTYTKQIAAGSGEIRMDYLLRAPDRRNLISIVNSGSSLFFLGDLPNTRIGDTAIITHVQIERINE